MRSTEGVKKVRVRVDPYQGVARMALSVVPEGYRFVSVSRHLDQATITYVAEEECPEHDDAHG